MTNTTANNPTSETMEDVLARLVQATGAWHNAKSAFMQAANQADTYRHYADEAKARMDEARAELDAVLAEAAR